MPCAESTGTPAERARRTLLTLRPSPQQHHEIRTPEASGDDADGKLGRPDDPATDEVSRLQQYAPAQWRRDDELPTVDVDGLAHQMRCDEPHEPDDSRLTHRRRGRQRQKCQQSDA